MHNKDVNPQTNLYIMGFLHKTCKSFFDKQERTCNQQCFVRVCLKTSDKEWEGQGNNIANRASWIKQPFDDDSRACRFPVEAALQQTFLARETCTTPATDTLFYIDERLSFIHTVPKGISKIYTALPTNVTLSVLVHVDNLRDSKMTGKKRKIGRPWYSLHTVIRGILWKTGRPLEQWEDIG